MSEITQGLILESQVPEGIEIYEAPQEDIDVLELPVLPNGYGFVGGAARAIAQRILFGEDAPVRDIDIAAFRELSPDLSLGGDLSREYMPDDFLYGHGVGIEEFDPYFNSRDFTFNEVAVVNGKILISKQGYMDLRDKAVRPTDYELTFQEDYMGQKITAKAILMDALFESQYGYSVPVYEEHLGGYIGDFYLALALNKAFQYGPAVTRLFVNKLVDKGFIEKPEGGDPLSLAASLSDDTMFKFRGSSAVDLLREHEEMPGEQIRGIISSDILSPLYDDPDYIHFANKANRFSGKGRQLIGDDH